MSWDKWIWIELIGFDNTLPDYGVAGFLGRMSVRPAGVVLFFASPEFLHRYEPGKTDFALDAAICSYNGRPFNSERKRQKWDSRQLRGLTAQLKAAGVAVYFTVFNGVITKEAGLPEYDVWGTAHPELHYRLADGTLSACICPWKTLADGGSYGEFFARKLTAFLRDFDFDGFMFGDGYNVARASLIEGDFSEAMIARFERECAVSVPTGSFAERAKFITGNLRGKWCAFLTGCQSDFAKKVGAAVHAAGRKFVALSAWTRDPFEAIWRYGTDYRALADAGLDALIVESSAGTVEMEHWNRDEETTMLDRNRAMLLRLRAALPGIPFIQLHCIKDDQEQYCVLRHLPTLAATEIYSLATMRFADSGERCVAGVMACLGDGITADEWQTLDRLWNSAFSLGSGEPESPILLWSDAALQAELQAYAGNRVGNSCTVAAELIAHGLPLAWSGTLKGAEKYPHTPVLVIHPRFFPAEELAALDRRPAPWAAIGLLADGSYGLESRQAGNTVKKFSAELRTPIREETLRFWATLPEKLPEPAFWDQAVAAMDSLMAFPIPAEPWKCVDIWEFNPAYLRVWSFTDGTVFAANVSPWYLPGRFKTARPVAEAESLTDYPCLPVRVTALAGERRRVDAKIPPYGIAVLKTITPPPQE